MNVCVCVCVIKACIVMRQRVSVRRGLPPLCDLSHLPHKRFMLRRDGEGDATVTGGHNFCWIWLLTKNSAALLVNKTQQKWRAKKNACVETL